jgi:hypothetical protein
MMDNTQLQEQAENLHDEPHLSTSDLVKSNERVNTAMPAARDQDGRSTPLFASHDAETYRSQWERIQIGFVDEPRKSVERADELVAAVIKRLAEVFADERNTLEHDWEKNEGVSTEELRVALRRYRSFFDRLLTV